MTGSIFRFIEGKSLGSKDLESHREAKKQCDGTGAGRECECWGTSAWIRLHDVRHALDIMPFMKQGTIIEVKIGPQHGVILHTPSRRQPEHRSFWRDVKTDFAPLSKIVSVKPLSAGD